MDKSVFLQPQTLNLLLKKSALFFFILVFAFIEASQAQVPMIRLKMHGLPNYLDETVVYYQSGATDGFDTEFDAYKLSGPNSVPQISQDYNSLLMAINGISPVTSTFSINIKTTANTTGNFTITATDFADLPPGTCVTLNDVFTGASVNILTTPYVFNLSNTTTISRFVLTIMHNDLPVLSELIQPTCQMINGGKFKVKGNAQAPWNYIWKDSTETIIQSSQSISDFDSISNLANGKYKVEITSASNSCYSNILNFTINEKMTSTATFSTPDTLIASVMQNFYPTNLSVNCNSYSWSFGDGAGNSSDFEPSYTYSLPGVYEVKLTGTNFTGCMDSTTKIINVIDLATSVKINDAQAAKLLNNGDNQFVIRINPAIINDMQISLYNTEGKPIYNEYYENSIGSDHINLNMNTLSNGIYILNLTSKNKNVLNAKIIIH